MRWLRDRSAEQPAPRGTEAGAEDVELEDEPSWGTFAPTGVALGSLGMGDPPKMIPEERIGDELQPECFDGE